MPELNDLNDILMPPTEKPKLPSGLNILTILTFIGCALGLCGSIYNFVSSKASLDKMETAINSPEYENMPALAKKFLNPEALEIARKTYENRVPMTIIGLVCLGLCLYGALQMRQLKKQGYVIYLIGEILPVVAYGIFIGLASLTGFGGIIMCVFTLLFVLLYTAQRKYLVN